MVECAGLENRMGASLRGFDSHPPRHFSDRCRLSACPAKRSVRSQTGGAAGEVRRKVPPSYGHGLSENYIGV